MAFSTYDFIFLFLPLTLCIYHLLVAAGALRAAVAALFLCSLMFYAWWNPYHLWILGTSLILNYAFGALLVRNPNRAILTAGVAVNLGLIIYYKYKLFLGGIIAQIAGQDWVLAQVILPLGISFFTFQQIAWLVDCYRREVRTTPQPLDYVFFVAFFPHLIAGPIVHHAELVPQVKTAPAQVVFTRDVVVGASIFLLGLSKKILIADRLAPFANYFFEGTARGGEFGFVAAWLGLLAYSLQIYFDFSAYSDMAIGLARMFGFKFPLNFNSPYKSASIIDFWHRWHMTLSRFLRVYLYIPLGGSRKGSSRRYVNLMITMLLGGLWHGANWTFVAWGALHGGYLAVNHGWRSVQQRYRPAFALPNWTWIAVTFFFVSMAWVFFRSDNFSAAMSAFAQLFGLKGPWLSAAIGEPVVYGVPETLFRNALQAAGVAPLISGLICQTAVIGAAMAIAMTMPNVAEIFSRDFTPACGSIPGGAWSIRPIAWRANLAWLAVTAVLFAICVVFMRRPAPFLYFQF